MTPDRLAALHAAAFVTPRPWGEAEFAALLAEPGVFLVAEEAGFALGRAVLDEAELLTIAVAPEARRQGLGHRLMTEWEVAAAARGARRALLEVAQDNTAARALYAARGFTPAGRRRGYYRHPDGHRVDALVLELHLPAPR